MGPTAQIPAPLMAYCGRWSEQMADLSNDNDRIEYIRSELPALLLDRSVTAVILKNMVSGQPYPDIRQCGMFDKEILLYLDPGQHFSLRLYFHEPGQYTIIHDHNAWGISGTPFGKLRVIQYRREDDGRGDGYARLRECDRRTLSPGEVDITLPLNEGIHQTGSPGNEINVMISVYGRPLRRPYVNQFDAVTHRVIRLYPPRMKKRLLARQALDMLEL